MGGCRCTYRNCSSRTDGKTHMFHYPVFDKVRCHQWLTNAHKLEFLNLKVSQLKNRVVCQHHFKDDCFMNFKKDKLTFDAVPTENGPYCDSTQLDETKNEQEESKVFSISLDDIENEYLTIVDKKANFSVKYGDFLTNCDLMDLDSLNSLNQIDDNNQIALKGLCELAANPIVSKELIPSKRPVKTAQSLPHRNRGKRFDYSNSRVLKNPTCKKNALLQGNLKINHDNTVDINKLIVASELEEEQNSLNLILKVSHVPIEFEGTKSNDKIPKNVDQWVNVKLLDDSKPLSNQSMDVSVLDETRLLNDQPIGVKVLNESRLLNQQSFDESKQLNDQSIDVKVLDQNLSHNNADGSLFEERKKIRIISEKKISEPVSLIGKLEPVSPTRILTFPNKRRSFNLNPVVEVPTNSITQETSLLAADKSNDNIILEESESGTMNIISKIDNVSSLEKINDVININPSKVLPNNACPQKTSNVDTNKTFNKVLPKTSLLRNKIPPERVAAIAEKRKFNMKLRDIVEDCLDKLEEPDKSDFDRSKLSPKTKIMQSKKQQVGSKKQQVGSYLAKDPELPSVQDYTIAYLEARMKKMEDNLLNKIEENSQKIVELKQTYVSSCDRRSAHTQTSVSEDVHKRQLYKELSKYLSQEANSLIYEELFINKYTKDVPKGSPSRKRRKRR